DDDGLLRVEACGLCGTDHEQYSGALPGPFPFVPGHEVVGVLERVGDAAAGRWGVTPGQRVAVEVFQACGRCRPCREGAYRLCREHGLDDMYGGVSVDRPPGLWGGYATHQYLAPDSLLHPVPPGLPAEIAALFNPLGAGIRWGVTVPGTREGDVMVVLGPGIRGLCATAAAREAGAGFVLVTGRGARDSGRLALAPRFGAHATVDVTCADPVRVLKEATGGLADVVVDVTAKAPEALAQAVSLARPGGTIVMAGTKGSADTPGFWPDLLVYKELRVLGALGVDAPAYRAALDLLASGRYPFADLPRRQEGFEGAEALLQTMAGDSDVPPPVHGVLVPRR
ncbi:MAG TPA: zinc-binding dehydrogenase, partial [Acidimicrobiales bacterium]|nr:zinc-binding dehydrogenase [Acidimicrobiales bacterium]